MASGLELVYKGKEDKGEILTKTVPLSLYEVKRFGKNWSDNWYNMLIFGDNLSILRTLMDRPDIKGHIKLVYIDPPFSKNQAYKAGKSRTATISSSKEDWIAYEDFLVGADYLDFLRKRLVFLRELMADDGSIYVHIDWKMGHFVKVIMDEVFGQERFINDIARIKCNPKSFGRKAYGNIRDMVLFYSKTDDYIWNDSTQDYTQEQIERLFPKIDGNGRHYTTNPLHAPGETVNGPTGQPWRGIHPPRGRHWRYPPKVLEELDKRGLIEWSKTRNPRKKIYADEHVKKKTKRQDIWEFKDPAYPSYPTEKNLEMLKVIVGASSNPGDIVMDCFAGSGTTMVAAEELNRKWIGIDNSKLAMRVSLERLLKIRTIKPFILYNATNESLSQTLKEFL